MQLLWCLERLPTRGHEAGTVADGFRNFGPRVCASCPPNLELLHGPLRLGRDQHHFCAGRVLHLPRLSG